MATHSSILAWRILWTEELGRLQSMGLQRVRHDWGTEHTHIFQDKSYSWKWKRWSLSCIRLLATPLTVAYQAPLSMEFSRQNTGVGCHSPLQETFWTQGSNQGLLHCRQILYCLSHLGCPDSSIIDTIKTSNISINKTLTDTIIWRYLMSPNYTPKNG